MSTARYQQTATLLPNGKVLVTAGTTGVSTSSEPSELYNPATGTWSDSSNGLPVCPPGNWCRANSQAVLLGSGKVLVAGGLLGLVSSYRSGTSSTAILYDPTTNSWSSTGAMTTPRAKGTATVLGNGQVLVAGGNNFNALPGKITRTNTPLASAELYTP